MRRLASSLAILVVAGTVLIGPSIPGHAARLRPGDVTLRLVEQTPWNSIDRPELRLTVRAANGSERVLRDLSLNVTLYVPVRSRTAYESSLHEDPPDALFAVTFQLNGVLGPGEARTIRPDPIDLRNTVLPANPHNLYPMRIDLRTGFEPVATIRSPLIFLHFPEGQARAEQPLRLGWSFVLHEPIAYGPDGAFSADAVARLTEEDARLRRTVAALSAIQQGPRPAPADLVISPVLLDQLVRLSSGFTARDGEDVDEVVAQRDAAGLLRRMRALVTSPRIEVSALPYASPYVPTLIHSPLADDLEPLVERGRDLVEGVLGVPPDSSLFRPLDSYLDQQSLFELNETGFTTFLVDPDLVIRPPRPNEFAQPATASLEAGVSRRVTAVVPDAGVQAILRSDLVRRDPRLAAQAVLGELATIWLEAPGEKRAVAMAFQENIRLPGSLFGPLLNDVADAPFLDVQRLSDLTRRFPPPRRAATLVPRPGPLYPQWYVARVQEDRERIATYRSMLVEPSPLPARLETEVLTAESAQFAISLGPGAGFLNAVRDRLDAEFSKVGLDTATSSIVTLTSRVGDVPVGITSDTGYPVRVRVRLVSNHLSFAADSREIRLTGPSKTLLFRVQAKTTGRFPVQVQIRTPSGFTLRTGQLVVRSTAYNLVALLVTIGAAVFLLLWWGRRFLPRRKTS